MTCQYDKVFREFLCLPPEPWICAGGPAPSHAIDTQNCAASDGLSELAGYAGTLSTPPVTSLQWSGATVGKSYWTAWGKGSVTSNGSAGTDEDPVTVGAWTNPFTFDALSDESIVHRLGAALTNDVDVMSIPIATVATSDGIAVTLALNPSDLLGETFLNVTSSSVLFSRDYQRLTAGNDALVVSAHIVAHAVDWRPGRSKS